MQPNQSTPEPSRVPDATNTPKTPEPQPAAENMGFVNGQPFQPTTPLSSSQFEQQAVQKPSKSRYFFIFLGILQAAGVAIFFLIMLWAQQQAKAGKSGTEFIGLLVYVTIVPAIGVIALINLIGLPKYIIKHKPRGKALALSIVSLLISLLLAGFGAYSVYQFRVALPNHMEELSRQSDEKFKAQAQQFAADNAKPEITKEEAMELLQTCKLKGFYYTNQTDKSDPANGGWGELSATGVVLTKVDGKPYRISIADRLIGELVPIARQAQRNCSGGPQFWHDGDYEQIKDGAWYFKNERVNSTQPEKTKEDAINLMQNCQVDYFVGRTTTSYAAKETSTKQWLENAQATSSGVAILENSPKTYVFVSTAMTADLQDDARQFRQACYNKKKLYVMIDDWVETEYPQGSWTRVKQ